MVVVAPWLRLRTWPYCQDEGSRYVRLTSPVNRIALCEVTTVSLRCSSWTSQAFETGLPHAHFLYIYSNQSAWLPLTKSTSRRRIRRAEFALISDRTSETNTGCGSNG